MKAAKIENSPRLQRVAKYLSDGLKHSTRDIMYSAHACAVSAAVSELRENGFDIKCQRVDNVWYYRMEV